MTDRQSSGVRNLRAMFENSTAASPEPRGRSPGARLDADGNRPPSKVRASFVSVEPHAHLVRDLGATKGTAEGVNSPAAHRRESFSVSEDVDAGAVAELKRVVSEEKEARKNSEVIEEAIPEQAVETRESSRAPPAIREIQDEMPNLGSIMKGADFPEPTPAEEQKPAEEPAAPEPVQAPAEPSKEIESIEEKMAALSVAETPADNPDKTSGAQEEACLKPADPKDEATVSGGEALPPPAEVLPSTNKTTTATPKMSKAETATPSKAKTNGTAAKGTTNGTPSGKKPAAISTAKASASQASAAKSPLPRSPGLSRKPPTTPKAASTASAARGPAVTKEHPKPSSSKDTTKAPAPKASRTSLRPATATATTTSTASAAAKAKAPVTETKKPAAKPATAAPSSKNNATTSPSGFKKPRPKSPTRPVRLPSHLTAPTASSAAKHEEDGGQKLGRKPSTATRPVAPKAAPAARKQASRASLAPSTSAAAPKRPVSQASTRGGADDGFLARMMRPTASSASKNHDKPASPPRRAASTRAATKPKEGVVAKGKKKVGEVVTKAKEAVTNGHSEEQPQSQEQAASSDIESQNAAESAQVAEPEREATPAEQVEPSVVELQTPQFNTEQMIR